MEIELQCSPTESFTALGAGLEWKQVTIDGSEGFRSSSRMNENAGDDAGNESMMTTRASAANSSPSSRHSVYPPRSQKDSIASNSSSLSLLKQTLHMPTDVDFSFEQTSSPPSRPSSRGGSGAGSGSERGTPRRLSSHRRTNSNIFDVAIPASQTSDTARRSEPTFKITFDADRVRRERGKVTIWLKGTLHLVISPETDSVALPDFSFPQQSDRSSRTTTKYPSLSSGRMRIENFAFLAPDHARELAAGAVNRDWEGYEVVSSGNKPLEPFLLVNLTRSPSDTTSGPKPLTTASATSQAKSSQLSYQIPSQIIPRATHRVTLAHLPSPNSPHKWQTTSHLIFSIRPLSHSQYVSLALTQPSASPSLPTLSSEEAQEGEQDLEILLVTVDDAEAAYEMDCGHVKIYLGTGSLDNAKQVCIVWTAKAIVYSRKGHGKKGREKIVGAVGPAFEAVVACMDVRVEVAHGETRYNVS